MDKTIIKKVVRESDICKKEKMNRQKKDMILKELTKSSLDVLGNETTKKFKNKIK